MPYKGTLVTVYSETPFLDDEENMTLDQLRERHPDLVIKNTDTNTYLAPEVFPGDSVVEPQKQIEVMTIGEFRRRFPAFSVMDQYGTPLSRDLDDTEIEVDLTGAQMQTRTPTETNVVSV